jgi:two-component system, OmpR family, phosphate regulon sensor histidine kinase PhoR
MNQFESFAAPNNEREHDLKRTSDFHAVLLGIAGHDLRQPLQVIRSSYELLSNKLCSDADRSSLELGELAVDRLTQQLDCLAAALRLYEYTTTMRFAPVPLAPLFNTVLIDNIEFAGRKGLNLSIRSTRAVVISNALLLEAVLRNLVHNALKYTNSGRVLLGCRRRGADLRIDIYDTGIGMSEGQLPRIFEAFQRLDSTKPDGLGLGLFVVRKAIQLLDHRIEVSSTVGHGSRFSVFVKLAPDMGAACG